MKNAPFEDLQNKDFWTALALWLVIEFISFALFPVLGLINPGDRLRTWFITSLPLGLGGAFLMAASSRFVASAGDRNTRSGKKLLALLGQFGGIVGLGGMMFPLFMVTIEYLAKAAQ